LTSSNTGSPSGDRSRDQLATREEIGWVVWGGEEVRITIPWVAAAMTSMVMALMSLESSGIWPFVGIKSLRVRIVKQLSRSAVIRSLRLPFAFSGDFERYRCYANRLEAIARLLRKQRSVSEAPDNKR